MNAEFRNVTLGFAQLTASKSLISEFSIQHSKLKQ